VKKLSILSYEEEIVSELSYALQPFDLIVFKSKVIQTWMKGKQES
jgi:hypothetical protein